MKKFVTITLVLLFAFFIGVVAEVIPSKTVVDMISITSKEGLIVTINVQDERALSELNKVKESNVQDYFGGDVMYAVMMQLGKEDITVAEFAAIFVQNAEEELEAVHASITFPV